MNLQKWNKEQIKESQSADNLWFFKEHYPDVEPTPERLLMYYIENGGAKNYRESHDQDTSESSS